MADDMTVQKLSATDAWRQWTRTADAEQARATGGMVALLPRSDDALRMAVPGGEDEGHLHCTLVFLGDDVRGMPDGGLQQAVAQISDMFSPITARVFGHAVYNPDGEEDAPATVYVLGDQLGNPSELTRIHDEVLGQASKLFSLPYQHQPWAPHVTAGYNLPVTNLGFTGDIILDRLILSFAGKETVYPLT